MSRIELPLSFWGNVDKSEDCWTWTAGRTRGYGAAYLGGRQHTDRRHRAKKVA